jgi:hypothetical protein
LIESSSGDLVELTDRFVVEVDEWDGDDIVAEPRSSGGPPLTDRPTTGREFLSTSAPACRKVPGK